MRLPTLHLPPVVLPLAAGLLTGIALTLHCAPRPAPLPPAIIGQRVEVHDTVTVLRDRPTPKQGALAGIVWRDAPVAITLTSQQRNPRPVLAYCAPVTAHAAGDSGSPSAAAAPPAILPEFAGRYDGGTLRLWSRLGDGRVWSQTTAAHAPLQWLSVDSSVIVREQRFGARLVRGLARCAPLSGASGLVGLAVDGRRGAGLAFGSALLTCAAELVR